MQSTTRWCLNEGLMSSCTYEGDSLSPFSEDKLILQARGMKGLFSCSILPSSRGRYHAQWCFDP
jgi:hypothetical protein